MKRDDILWKVIIEDLIDDFLLFFYPDANEHFDLAKGFEFLDKELDQLFPPEDDHYEIRYVDKLIKVFTRNQEEKWILVHIEVQSQPDKDFSKRMFKYYMRILDKYDKPITAFAIFADANKNFHPNVYESEYLGTKLTYSYNTFKILEQDDATLEASNNPFAMAVLSAKLGITSNKIKDEQLFGLAYDLAKRLLAKQMPKQKIRSLMNFLRFYLRFDKQEMFTKFEQEIAILTERSTTMGIEEFLLDRAKKEGREEERKKANEERDRDNREAALKMKKSGIAIDLIANITGLCVKEIENLS